MPAGFGRGHFLYPEIETTYAVAIFQARSEVELHLYIR